jgi:hypothetical protein
MFVVQEVSGRSPFDECLDAVFCSMKDHGHRLVKMLNVDSKRL